ncbi:MAG: PQQ-binding-like beta-propeller repeat protein, partial [Bacteroidota bacterium]
NAMNDIAFVILSGDVTEMGSDEQLRKAKSLLDSLNKPCYVIPGNHDTKWSESGCTTFPKLFGNDKFVFEHDKFRFIGLHQGPRMRMGDGHWAPEDMRWLDSVLIHLPNKQQPLFFITHYPVDSSISNWYVMLDKVKKYNTQAILHGHGHRNGVFNFEGVAGIMSRSNLRTRDSIGSYTIGEVRNDTLFVSERTPGVRTSKPWHHILIDNKNYSADTTHHYRPDFSINSRYPDVKVKWKFSSGWTIASAPLLSHLGRQLRVVIGNASGNIYSLRIFDGKEIWRFKTRGPIFASAGETRLNVVIGSTDSSIYCLSSENGNLVWETKTHGAVLCTPAANPSSWLQWKDNYTVSADDILVIIGSSDRIVRGLDGQTGKVQWEFNDLSGFVETKPTRQDEKVIFGAWDGYLYALNEWNGSLVWKWKGNKEGALFSPAACVPVFGYGKLFIVAPDRMMTAIDLKTGETIWRTGKYQVRESIGISEDGEQVYIRTLRDSILALSTTANGLAQIWCTNVGFGYDHNYAALVEKDGTLFYGTRNGLLIALNARTGKVKWQHKTGVALLNTVAPIDGRSVVVSNVDGEVMLVEAED